MVGTRRALASLSGMRTLALAVASCLAAACSITTAEPQLLVQPYLAVYQLRGDIAMQSNLVAIGGFAFAQDNPANDLRTFGQDHYREDFGIRADFGDGFGGLRVDYYKLDQKSAGNGSLANDFGALPATDIVTMDVEMDELRIGYLEPLFHVKSKLRDKPLDVQFALGAVLAHREMDLRARSLVSAREQKTEIEGDVGYAAARFRIGWHDFAIDADYAISPDLALGGDFEGTLQDLELRASYTVPYREITFFGGWRYSTLPAEGHARFFRYDADLVLDGFQLGVMVTF